VARADAPFAASIPALLAYAAAGFREAGLTATHAMGLAEGLRDPALGHAYLASALDPTLDAVATRLAAHQARGEMRREVEPRHAALALLAPLVLACLHQDALGGRAAAPLDVAAFGAAHAAGFVRAYAAPAG
jgi:hypothetical protein